MLSVPFAWNVYMIDKWYANPQQRPVYTFFTWPA
jgi:hypothetical protein